MNWFQRLISWFFPTPLPAPPPPTPKPVPKPPPTPIPPPPLSITDQFLALLNQERAKSGLSPMTSDPKLIALAQSWSKSQAIDDTMSHGDFQSRINEVYPNSYASENVAMGYPDVASTFHQWMNSPPHKDNMMGSYAIAGIARFSSNQSWFWTADFVRTI